MSERIKDSAFEKAIVRLKIAKSTFRTIAEVVQTDEPLSNKRGDTFSLSTTEIGKGAQGMLVTLTKFGNKANADYDSKGNTVTALVFNGRADVSEVNESNAAMIEEYAALLLEES